MSLRAGKLEIIKMLLDSDDKDIIRHVKPVFKNAGKPSKKHGLEEFYDDFREGIREVKSSLSCETELKDAKLWFNELQD